MANYATDTKYENIIVDAVQNAMNEIARRGYLTTYAGAIAV